MVQIDRANSVMVGLDLYTVAERHQSSVVEAIAIYVTKSSHQFLPNYYQTIQIVKKQFNKSKAKWRENY